MIVHRMLWKDGIHLTDDDTKILVVNVLNYLNINLGNVDKYYEEVDHRSSNNPDNKVLKKSYLGIYKQCHYR